MLKKIFLKQRTSNKKTTSNQHSSYQPNNIIGKRIILSQRSKSIPTIENAIPIPPTSTVSKTMQQPFWRKVWVEIACLMLKIDNLYEISEVQIHEVWQNYHTIKFEIAVVKGYVKNQPNTLKTFLITYFVNRLEQLIRIEKTYTKIDGMITYPASLNIQSYLHQIQRINFAKRNIYLYDEKMVAQVSESQTVGQD